MEIPDKYLSIIKYSLRIAMIDLTISFFNKKRFKYIKSSVRANFQDEIEALLELLEYP